MKKAIIAVFSPVVAIMAFFVPLVVFAQTGGHFVFVQQSQVTATSTYFGHAAGGGVFEQDWQVKIGTGYQGTTTAAFMTAVYTISGSPARYPLSIQVREYSDSTYTDPPVSTCQFLSSASAGSYPTTGTFVQLNGTACLLHATSYYRLDMQANSQPGVVDFTYYAGAPTATFSTTYGASGPDPSFPTFVPQFALTGDGFFITPTTTDSGLYLSGAQEFCNSHMGTSTAGIYGIGSDIANGLCQVFGYMFVPTPNSLQAFSDLQPSLAQKAPFSYVFGTIATWNALVASSTANSPVDTLDYHSLGIGSTTPIGNILPSFTAFAASTTRQYFPAGTFDALKGLASVAIILTLFADIFFTTRNLLTV